jgi:hypothetical protein
MRKEVMSSENPTGGDQLVPARMEEVSRNGERPFLSASKILCSSVLTAGAGMINLRDRKRGKT